MKIRAAVKDDIGIISENDAHISLNELETAVALGRVYIAEENGSLAGWLRYNLFWDNTPFMNMLFVTENFRGMGIGAALAERWEHDMDALGFRCVMTSSQQEEYSQHFFVKHGYKAVGGFMPLGEPYELIFVKPL